jgi:hypothetical protein
VRALKRNWPIVWIMHLLIYWSSFEFIKELSICKFFLKQHFFCANSLVKTNIASHFLHYFFIGLDNVVDRFWELILGADNAITIKYAQGAILSVLEKFLIVKLLSNDFDNEGIIDSLDLIFGIARRSGETAIKRSRLAPDRML